MSLLQQLDGRLTKLFAQWQVHVFEPREHMIQCNAVNVGTDFTKPRTNLLLRQRQAGGASARWEIFIDDDIEYRGNDARKRQLFQGAHRRRWQMLTPPQSVRGDLNHALRLALAWLASPLLNQQSPPADTPLPRQQQVQHHGEDEAADPETMRLAGDFSTLLAAYGEPLTQKRLRSNPGELSAGQRETADLAAVSLLARPPLLPVLSGASGMGKTFIAHRVAGEFLRRGLVQQVLEVQAAELVCGAVLWPDRDDRFRRLLNEARQLPRTLLIIEQLDLAMGRSPAVASILCNALDAGVMLLGIARAEVAPGWLAHSKSLEHRSRILPVPGLCRFELQALVHARLAELAEAPHTVNPQTLSVVIQQGHRHGEGNPGEVVRLFNEVLAISRWRQSDAIGPDDVYFLAEQVGKVDAFNEQGREPREGDPERS